MPLFGKPKQVQRQPRGLTDVVVLRALPELGQVPPPRPTLPVEVVHEAAMKALLWGTGFGLVYPAKRAALFRAAYGEQADAWYPLLAAVVERQAAEALGGMFTLEQLLPNHLLSGHSESPVSAYNTWLDLVGCFLLGCAGATSQADLMRSAIEEWCRQDTAHYHLMAALKSSGTPVPGGLLQQAPITSESLEAEIGREATVILREYETRFGPLA